MTIILLYAIGRLIGWKEAIMSKFEGQLFTLVFQIQNMKCMYGCIAFNLYISQQASEGLEQHVTEMAQNVTSGSTTKQKVEAVKIPNWSKIEDLSKRETKLKCCHLETFCTGFSELG